jgi:hypothetical protein
MYLLGHLAYLANRRAASNATAIALVRQLGFSRSLGSHHSAHYRPFLRYFTTVRRHWDAIASWAHAKEAPLPLSVDWLRSQVTSIETRTNDQWRLWHWLGTPYDPTVLRYETLQGDLNAFLANHQLGPVQLGRTKSKRNGEPYQEAFDSDSRQWVQDRYREEIDELGYQFEEIQ